MKFQDWHTHNSLCRHAEGSIEDYIKRAIKDYIGLIGLSDHFPYEFLEGIEGIPYEKYAMTLNEIELYISTAENLKDKYRDKIEIKIAFEIDYIENQAGAHKVYLNNFMNRIDYILGSVHILQGKGHIFAFDDSRFLKNYEFYESINDVYMDYYNTLQNMIKSNEFSIDILSHFDLPKKFNKIPENPELIMEEIRKTLELVKKNDLTIEVNTSGLRKKVKEQYPSIEILELMLDLDIPILLGSDAHHPDEIAFQFKNIINMIKKIGYSQLSYFNERQRVFLEI